MAPSFGQTGSCDPPQHGLLFHRNISLIDALRARSLLEVVAIPTAFFVAFIPLCLLGFIDPIYVVYWSLGLTAIGLPLVRRARRHVAFH